MTNINQKKAGIAGLISDQIESKAKKKKKCMCTQKSKAEKYIYIYIHTHTYTYIISVKEAQCILIKGKLKKICS